MVKRKSAGTANAETRFANKLLEYLADVDLKKPGTATAKPETKRVIKPPFENAGDDPVYQVTGGWNLSFAGKLKWSEVNWTVYVQTDRRSCIIVDFGGNFDSTAIGPFGSLTASNITKVKNNLGPNPPRCDQFDSATFTITATVVSQSPSLTLPAGIPGIGGLGIGSVNIQTFSLNKTVILYADGSYVTL